MRVAIDTNVLVYAHFDSFAHHNGAKAHLTKLLHDPDTTLVVTPLILHELVHIVTDPKRFDVPASMLEATMLARAYLGRTNVECLPTDEYAMTKCLDLMEQHELGRKRLADTLFAATLLLNDVRRLLTYNSKDFAVFDLETVHPSP